MARPRKPSALLVLNGSAARHPDRTRERAGEPVDARPLGPPQDSMEPAARAAWAEIERLAPWLRHADRIAVEIAAVLLARFRTGGDQVPPQLLTRLETMLGRLGLTPSDRSRVAAGSRSTVANKFANNGRRPA